MYGNLIKRTIGVTKEARGGHSSNTPIAQVSSMYIVVVIAARRGRRACTTKWRATSLDSGGGEIFTAILGGVVAQD